MALVKLSELDGWEVEYPDQDIRGYPVVDPQGKALGTVQELLVNLVTEEAEAVLIEQGQHLPLTEIEVTGNQAVWHPGGLVVHKHDRTGSIGEQAEARGLENIEDRQHLRPDERPILTGPVPAPREMRAMNAGGFSSGEPAERKVAFQGIRVKPPSSENDFTGQEHLPACDNATLNHPMELDEEADPDKHVR